MGDAAAADSILIVEDDGLARAALETLLASHGHATLAAADALAAINLFRSGTRPRLILLDMVLPGADGWQFFAERARDPALAAIPVAIMTGVGIASEEWARALGAIGLLRKPIDVNQLLGIVRQYAGPGAAPP